MAIWKDTPTKKVAKHKKADAATKKVVTNPKQAVVSKPEKAVAPKPKQSVVPKPKQAVALNPKPSTSRNCDDDQSDAKNSQSSQDEEDLVEYDEETDDEYTDEETLPSINNVRSKTAENRSTINQQQHAPQQSQPIQHYYPPQSRNIDPVEKKGENKDQKKSKKWLPQ
jgi:hypothetical protein